MSDTIAEFLVEEARRLHLDNVRITRGKGKGTKHPRLCAELNGVPLFYVFPGSSGDYRAGRNCVCGLRRLVARLRERVGITDRHQTQAETSEARRPRNRRKSPSTRTRPLDNAAMGAPSVTHLDVDWRAPLLELAAQMRRFQPPEDAKEGLAASNDDVPTQHNLLYRGAAERARRNGQW